MAALALAARLASAALATAAVSVFPSLDGAGLLTFSPGGLPLPHPSLSATALTALTAWDGAFFGRAASRGAGEHDGAACAFAPWAGGVAGRGAAWLARWLLPPTAAASPLTPPAAALAASWAAFLGAAVALDAASEAYLPSGPDAAATRTLATLLFIFGPAAPFATALYAEAWHALGLGGGLVLASVGRPWASAACLALASASRSTGVMAAGLWALATPPGRGGPAGGRRATTAAAAADRLARAALATAPALLWQAAAWRTFCLRADGSPAPPWCAARAGLPLPGLLPRLPPPPILAVQARDWGVGPGQYWRFSNLPHFALAVPALGIAAAGLLAGSGGGLTNPPGGVGVPGESFFVFFFFPHPAPLFPSEKKRSVTSFYFMF